MQLLLLLPLIDLRWLQRRLPPHVGGRGRIGIPLLHAQLQRILLLLALQLILLQRARAGILRRRCRKRQRDPDKHRCQSAHDFPSFFCMR
jgi:hypothetical protein